MERQKESNDHHSIIRNSNIIPVLSIVNTFQAKGFTAQERILPRGEND